MDAALMPVQCFVLYMYNEIISLSLFQLRGFKSKGKVLWLTPHLCRQVFVHTFVAKIKKKEGERMKRPFCIPLRVFKD